MITRPATRCLDLVRATVGRQPAVVEHHDPVGLGVGLVQVMGGEEDGSPAGDEVAHRDPEGAPQLHVHGHGRLVQDQQVRVRQDRQRVPQPLGLAPGQLLGPGAEEAPQLRPLDHLRQRQRVRVQSTHQPQHLADRCPVQQGPGLQHRAHPAGTDGRRRLHAEHPHLTGVRPDQAQDEFGGGGLPGPVGSEHGHDLTGGDGQVKTVDGTDVGERLGQGAELDSGCHGFESGWSTWRPDSTGVTTRR